MEVRVTTHIAGGSQATGEWSKFLSKCLATRLEPEKFGRFAPLQHAKYPLPQIAIADLFLKPQPKNKDYLDPRIPRYLQILLELKYVDTPSILKALYKYSTSHVQSQDADGTSIHNGEGRPKQTLRWGSSYGHEETTFYRITKAVRQGTGVKSSRDAIEVAKIMARWMMLFTAASASFAAADVMGQLQPSQAQTEMESARAAFVMLLLAVCENQVVLSTLSRPFARHARASLSESLESFIPPIQMSSSQVAAALELFRTETLAGFEPVDKKKAAENAELDDILDSTMGLQNFEIPDLVITNSRAGLYIYLNAALVGRPLIDDTAFFHYLNNRYQGDIQTTAIDLVLASFDVLANSVFRNEGQKTAHLLRSYLINKVPLLLSSFVPAATPVFPFDPQYCVSHALSRIDQNAFPTMSSMFDDTRTSNTFTDSVRQDFCFACCLHGLVQESSIEELLGEITYQTLPSGGRYVKEKLVRDCMADPEKIHALVKELDSMDGNVGAVCQALTEVLGQLCHTKETMSLKMLCSQLARNPLYLDVLLLFDKPTKILYPLCELLDNWRYEEDQGEYQPIYEEFGSVLLLLLAFVYRYNLSATDLGIRSADSFVTKLLSKGNLSRSLDDLTDQEKDHVGGWIRGLFDSDAGGLGDDLISSCPPQDFYLLIPTLFQQITVAFSNGQLPEENLKSGVEYLVDTFLLPSLVTAIMFLSDSLWVDKPPEQKAIIRILQLILQPSSISNEASTMLSAVLNMVAKPLEHSLRAYQRQDPKSQEVVPLLKALAENLPLSRRTGAADHTELEAWTSTQNGGFTSAIRHTIADFIQWSSQPVVKPMPTSYSHRQFMAALQMLGAPSILQLILDELKSQTEIGNPNIAFDIGCAIICAPDAATDPPPQTISLLDAGGGAPVPVQRRLSLRDVLKSKAEDWKKIQKTDPVMAETIVRLYRKVEAQMTVPETQPVIPTALDLEAAVLDDAISGAAPADSMVLDTVDLGLGGSAATSAGGLDMGMGADDMFSGLGALDTLDWGDIPDMDMT